MGAHMRGNGKVAVHSTHNPAQSPENASAVLTAAAARVPNQWIMQINYAIIILHK